jgi:hypothetical protein
MSSNDPFAIGSAAGSTSGAAQPCGCAEAGDLSAGADLLTSLDAALSAIEAGGALASEEAGVDLVALDDALAQAEMLDPFAEAGDGAAGFAEILSLLERYPGLKVTFSF